LRLTRKTHLVYTWDTDLGAGGIPLVKGIPTASILYSRLPPGPYFKGWDMRKRRKLKVKVRTCEKCGRPYLVRRWFRKGMCGPCSVRHA
jgi:hypothetical protein